MGTLIDKERDPSKSSLLRLAHACGVARKLNLNEIAVISCQQGAVQIGEVLLNASTGFINMPIAENIEAVQCTHDFFRATRPDKIDGR